MGVDQQFGYIRLNDSYTSGSSIMPQKKNADAAELVRGKSGRVTGNLVQLLMVMKALPLTYNKDMQEDKEAVFDTFDTLILCLKAMTGMVSTMAVNKGMMLEDAENGFSTATDLADWLVRNAGLPFRDAHHVTGKIVKLAESVGVKLHELEDMQDIEPKITKNVFEVLSVEKSVKSRRFKN
jgi:argininosuccinate lyase